MQLKTSSYNDQVTNENKIKKLSFVNDSLVTAINKKDTLIDSLRVANVSFKKDKEKEKAKLIYAKKASTLTRDQEYDKKAQFIYNFGTYIEWPVEYNGTEFIIGVVGDADVIKKLQSTIDDKKVKGKKVRIEKYTKGAKYNIIYITNSKTSEFSSVKDDCKKNKTLFICDDELMYSTGSHIVFIMDEDKVRYLLNKLAIEKVGLKVSQELMRFSG
ncbi:MAG: YfiR family protein [Bacteroidia bacterium]